MVLNIVVTDSYASESGGMQEGMQEGKYSNYIYLNAKFYTKKRSTWINVFFD